MPSRTSKVPHVRSDDPGPARGLGSAWHSAIQSANLYNPAAMAIKRDYYEILGVPRDASDEEIKRAFRRAAQRHHPDIDASDGAEERFKELNEAYRVLSDRQRRTAYDMFGHAGVDGASRRRLRGIRRRLRAVRRHLRRVLRRLARPARGGGAGWWPAPTCATT